MILWTYESLLCVKREESDPKLSNDSQLWYQLRNAMRRLGYDVIKKNPAKDNGTFNLTSADFYLRDRKKQYCIFDPGYAVRSLYKEFAGDGSFTLDMHWEGSQCPVKIKRTSVKTEFGHWDLSVGNTMNRNHETVVTPLYPIPVKYVLNSNMEVEAKVIREDK